MGKISEPSPVKLFTGMLCSEVSLFEEVAKKLGNIYGPVDLESPVFPWEHTAYYQKEMGPHLKRKFIFFEKLTQPGDIAQIKLETMQLETQYVNQQGGRKINLDPGYLDAAKIVLASTKDFSHRIYLGSGIYGEVTLFFAGSNYQSLPYTFPDYRTSEYQDIFIKARESFKAAMKRQQHKT